jgi:hypothetical protein
VTETAVVEAVVEADTMKCASMGATEVATAETAAVATASMREGRRWHHEQRSDRKSFKHRETPGCPSPVLLVAVGPVVGSITTTTTADPQLRMRGRVNLHPDRWIDVPIAGGCSEPPCFNVDSIERD